MNFVNITIILSFLVGFPLLADSSSAYPPSPYETRGGKRAPTFSEANSTAMHFINLIDNQAYQGAWLDAGGLLQDVIPREVWAEGMKTARLRLGVVHARRVSSHHATKVLPGGTKGEFMVIHYETQFAEQPYSVETVVLMMEGPLGIWRVVSYRIGNS